MMPRPRGYPDGSARILVSIPAVSLSDIELPRAFVTEASVLPSEARTLDVFKHELAGQSPEGAWMLNVPHFPLEERGARGVAGPGLPASELFVPADLEDELSGVAGKYDKWRPYPASSASSYARKMATKFARKRCKMFLHAALTSPGTPSSTSSTPLPAWPTWTARRRPRSRK